MRIVFSKRAVLRAAVRAGHTRRHQREPARRRMGGPVGRGRHPEHPLEARRERPDAAPPDEHADVGDGSIGRPEQRGGPLESPGQQIPVRRLAKGDTERPAEVRRRQPGRARHVGHRDLGAVVTVREVAGSQQVASGRDPGHGSRLRSSGRPETRRRRKRADQRFADSAAATAMPRGHGPRRQSLATVRHARAHATPVRRCRAHGSAGCDGRAFERSASSEISRKVGECSSVRRGRRARMRVDGCCGSRR